MQKKFQKYKSKSKNNYANFVINNLNTAPDVKIVKAILIIYAHT